MLKSKTRVVELVLAVAFAASCAGQTKKTTTTAKQGEVVNVDVQPVEAGAFEKLDKKQRQAFMDKVIVPKMTAVFQAFDAKHFAKVGCVTCHGPGAREGKFEMPTASLPKLDFSKKDPKHQKWNAFMSSKVVPTMAAALGVKPYDRVTKTGFGCLKCHMKAETPAK